MTAIIFAAVEAAHEPITVLWALAGGLVLLAVLLGALAVVFQMVTSPADDSGEESAKSSEAEANR